MIVSEPVMDFRPTDDQALLRRSVREFAETEIRPHVSEWDEAQHFPSELIPRLAEMGLLGMQFPEEYGGVGTLRGRLLHLHRGTGARRSRGGAVGRGAQRAVRGAHLHVRHRVAETDLSHAAGQGREDRRVGTDRIDLGQRRRGHADAGRARGRRLGAERLQGLHDARPRRSCDGGHGGDRSRRPAAAASPRSSSSAARRA